MIPATEKQGLVKITLMHEDNEFNAIGVRGLDDKIMNVIVGSPKKLSIPEEIKKQAERAFKELGYSGTIIYT